MHVPNGPPYWLTSCHQTALFSLPHIQITVICYKQNRFDTYEMEAENESRSSHF